MSRLRTSVLALLAVVAFAAPALAGSDHAHAAAKVEVGKAAPDFQLVDHTGKTHKLSDYAGKVVVLEWTNPECPFVQRHYSEGNMTMIDLAKSHGDVVWLAVDSSNFVTAESATKWAQQKAIPYPILLDANGRVGRAYDARTTPHMFVIDAKGVLVYDGAIDSDARGNATDRIDYVGAALDAVLAGKTVETATTKPYGCSVKYASSDAKTTTSSR